MNSLSLYNFDLNKDLLWKFLLDGQILYYWSGVYKARLREMQMVKITKETLQHSGIMIKLPLWGILCHCKYSMKEYKMKIHLYFNIVLYNLEFL